MRTFPHYEDPTSPPFITQKIFLFSTSLLFTLTLTSACYCEDDQEKSAENKILLLKFNQKDGNFTGGQEYSYFNDTESFTINYNCEKLSDRITTTFYYVEMNAVLFKAEIKNEDGSGNILIPEDFKGS